MNEQERNYEHKRIYERYCRAKELLDFKKQEIMVTINNDYSFMNKYRTKKMLALDNDTFIRKLIQKKRSSKIDFIECIELISAYEKTQKELKDMLEDIKKISERKKILK